MGIDYLEKTKIFINVRLESIHSPNSLKGIEDIDIQLGTMEAFR